MPQRRHFNGHDKKIVAARQQWRCRKCTRLLDETYHVDHTVPLHSGGADSLDNAQALCVQCHAKKTVAEESERLHRLDLATRAGRRAPVVCTACRAVVSPFFASLHRCGGTPPPVQNVQNVARTVTSCGRPPQR